MSKKLLAVVLSLVGIFYFNISYAIAKIPFDVMDSIKSEWNIRYFHRDQKTLVIQYHSGGKLDDELFRIRKIENLGYKVALTDYTVSAGTLWLRFPQERLCIDPNANFYFHQPFTKSNFGNDTPSKYHTQRYFNMLPEPVRNTILKQKVPAWKKPDPDTNLPWIDYIRISGKQAIADGWAQKCPDYVIPNFWERLFGGYDRDVPPRSNTF